MGTTPCLKIHLTAVFLFKTVKSDSGNNKYLIFFSWLWNSKPKHSKAMNSQIGCFPVPKWSLLQYLSDKNVLIAREKNKNITKLLFKSKASHYPTLNIHVEACSNGNYCKTWSHVREQEKHRAHFYGIYMYRKSLDWAWSETCSF